MTLLALLLAVPARAALIQHLDATVSISVTTNGSGVVTLWSDQSEAGNDASPATGSVLFPSTSVSASGLSGVDLGATRNSLELFTAATSESWLDQSAGGVGFCVLVAFKCDGLNSNNWNDLIGNSTSVGSGFGLRYGAGGNMQAYLGGVTINKGGASVAGGDTVVYGFNYNAATDHYEFWDSKNYSSKSGTVASGNFSAANAVTLGSTTSGSRFMKGLVGEVQVHDAALSASEFKAARESLAEKWAAIPIPVAVNWRVVPEDPGFATEDVVLAAVSLTDPGLANPLPADPANSDCTATFQEAIAAVASVGGGTVFVPDGHYRLDGRLELPTGVTLRGRWKRPVTGQPIEGTILKAYVGRTNAASAPFIGLRAHSGVRDLAIWYPEQLPNDIQPYSPTIQSLSGGNPSVENLTLVNAYVGVTTRLFDGSGTIGAPFVRGLYGTPLKTGLELDQLSDVGRVETVHFSPAFWKGSGLADAPTADEHAGWIYANGTGVIVRRIDWSYLAYVEVEGYSIGFAGRPSLNDGRAPNGQFYRFDLRDCQTGMYLEDISYAGFQVTRFNIQNAVTGVFCEAGAGDVALFQSCTLEASGWAVRSLSDTTLLFQNCEFPAGGIKLDSAGDLSVLNCDFGEAPGNHVELGASVRASLVGNRFVGAPHNCGDLVARRVCGSSAVRRG